MPAPEITPLPAPPLRSSAPAVFTSTAETFLEALPGFVEEANALGAYMEGVEVGAIDWGDIAGDIAEQADLLALIAAAVAGKANAALAVEAVAGTSYTFALADAGKHKRFTAAGAVTATVPPDSVAAIPVGSRIRITAAGGAGTTLAPGAGVTLNSRGGALASAGQYSVFEIEKVATDEWDVLGDLV